MTTRRYANTKRTEGNGASYQTLASLFAKRKHTHNDRYYTLLITNIVVYGNCVL